MRAVSHVPRALHITIHRPEELSASLRRAWHQQMDESPDYANPFLGPEFAAGIGAYRGEAHVAVLHEDGEPVGFFPYERNAFGVGRAIGLGLSDCQALVHRPGVTWNTRALLRACGLSVFEFDHQLPARRARSGAASCGTGRPGVPERSPAPRRVWTLTPP